MSAEILREYHRLWRLAFADKVKRTQKKYRCSPKGRAYHTQYRTTDKCRAQIKRYAQSIGGRASQRRYDHSAKGVLRSQKAWSARRARKLKATIGDPKEIAKIYARKNELRQWFDVEVDHIIPLSKGGAHSPGNLQIIYALENARKGASLSYIPKVIFR